MFIQKSTRRAMRQKHVNPLLLWERVITTAVTSNGYPTNLQIRVLMDLQTGDHNDLLVVAGELSSTVYEDHAIHYRMHQLAALIRKYPKLNLRGVNPEEKALGVFRNAEWRSKWTNRKFSLIERHGLTVEAAAIHRMRSFINYVLRNKEDVDEDGPNPTPNLGRIFSQCTFTGGASLGVHGNATNLARKLMQGDDGGFTCRPEALSLAAEAVWNNFHMREFFLSTNGGLKPSDDERDFVCHDEREFISKFLKSVKLVCHNKVAFVTKTAEVHRTVAAEPTLQTYVLKGIDLEMRDLLMKVGLDLRNQEPNAKLAWLGSQHWESEDPYCTIDLTSASAMLCRQVVKLLLPPLWFELLDKCRSEYYELPNGDTGRYEQFASMGNGSCFPLQTLIFASVCHTAYAELGEAPDFRVYGDDIIVRRRVFDRVISLLKFLGFKPNSKKTFSQGPFRESCGADWHSGQNVRPIFLDHELDSPEKIFGFHNQSVRRGGMVALYFQEIRELLFNELPASCRLVCDYDPSSPSREYGKTIDGAFWVTHDIVMSSPLCFWNRQTFSWAYTVYVAEAVEDVEIHRPREDGGASQRVLTHATYMAALSGASSDKTFTLRYTDNYRVTIKNRYVRWPDEVAIR